MENNIDTPLSDDKQYFKIQLRVSRYELHIFKKAKNELNISARRLIELLNNPCNPCDATEITIFSKNKKKSLTIKRSFLCRNI